MFPQWICNAVYFYVFVVLTIHCEAISLRRASSHASRRIQIYNVHIRLRQPNWTDYDGYDGDRDRYDTKGERYGGRWTDRALTASISIRLLRLQRTGHGDGDTTLLTTQVEWGTGG